MRGRGCSTVAYAENSRRPANRAWAAKWDTLLHVVNGDLLHLQHHCLFRECYQDGEQAFSRAKAAIRVADAVAGVIAAARPKAPALNKWTKLGPVIDWLMHAICIGYALPAVLPIAFSKDVNCAKKPKLEVEEALLTNQVNFKASHLLKYPTHQPPACPARKPVRVRLPRHSSVLSPHQKMLCVRRLCRVRGPTES